MTKTAKRDEHYLKQVLWAWNKAKRKVIGDRELESRDCDAIAVEMGRIAPNVSLQDTQDALRWDCDLAFDEVQRATYEKMVCDEAQRMAEGVGLSVNTPIDEVAAAFGMTREEFWRAANDRARERVSWTP